MTLYDVFDINNIDYKIYDLSVVYLRKDIDKISLSNLRKTLKRNSKKLSHLLCINVIVDSIIYFKSLQNKYYNLDN